MFRKQFASLVLVVAIVSVSAVGFVSAAETSEEPVPTFLDGRINSFDAAAPVAVFPVDYGTGMGLDIWRANEFGAAFELRVSPEEIAAVDSSPEEATLIAAEGGTALYRLPNGDYQIVASSNNGETYYLSFPELYDNVGYYSYFAK